jgi:hypothetical protein
MDDPQKQEETYGTGKADDTSFGKAAADDAERVDAGEQPDHDGSDVRAAGKAEPAGE